MLDFVCLIISMQSVMQFIPSASKIIGQFKFNSNFFISLSVQGENVKKIAHYGHDICGKCIS